MKRERERSRDPSATTSGALLQRADSLPAGVRLHYALLTLLLYNNIFKCEL